MGSLVTTPAFGLQYQSVIDLGVDLRPADTNNGTVTGSCKTGRLPARTVRLHAWRYSGGRHHLREGAMFPSAGMYEQLVERQQNLHDDQDDDIPFDAQRVFGLQQLQLGFHGA